MPANENQGTVDLGLSTVEGNQVRDESLTVTFFEATNPQRAIVKATGLTYPPKPRFTVPAFPQAKNLMLEASASRFRLIRSDAFTLNDGESIKKDFTAFRDPARWDAVFDPWNQLPSDFDTLRNVMGKSPGLRIRGGRSFDLFTSGDYDSVANRTEVFAKASMLNLYAKTSLITEPIGGRNSWFSFVASIIEIGRERIIAKVDPKMGEIVRHIKDNMSSFDKYKNTPAANHFTNIPAGYAARKSDMFSVKTKEDIGNLQLTMIPATSPDGASCLLLDADIDENGKLMLHLADVFKHKFTGGTQPFDIHEYLAVTYKDRRLGYRLI